MGAALLALAGLLLLGGGDSTPGPGYGGPSLPPTTGSKGRAELVRLLDATGMSADWRDFFLLVAVNESGYNPRAANLSATEASASAKMYNRNRAKLLDCPWPASAFTWGSGGYFGMMPTLAVLHLPPDLRCVDPSAAVFVEGLNIAAAVDNARSLLGWSNYKTSPSYLNLRAGWGWPAKMGDPAFLAEKLPRYQEHARRARVAESLLGKVPALAGLPTSVQVLDRLAALPPT